MESAYLWLPSLSVLTILAVARPERVEGMEYKEMSLSGKRI
jgi:hypothetical protein